MYMYMVMVVVVGEVWDFFRVVANCLLMGG